MGDERNGRYLAKLPTPGFILIPGGAGRSRSRFSLDRRRGQLTSSARCRECILKSPTGSVWSCFTPSSSSGLTVQRPVVCKEFFQALEACHADKWRKWTGGCNNDKQELNMCLRQAVRSPCVRPHVPVSLTSLGLATRGFGTKPRTSERTETEDRECLEGVAP